MQIIKYLLGLTLIFQTINCDIFAVLVSGSNSFWNYRHQADVCHAYHVLRNKGIPQQNIILMSYNDCITSEYNIYPGKLFNQASDDRPGYDVYEGCIIDYEGDDVNPQNYLAIITGNSDKVKGGNGRVLQAGAQDEVFLYFTDHGAPGMIMFPEENLYADQLLQALKEMNQKSMYNKLTFYMEACQSGSMFQSLPADINVYAVSAASPSEVSYAQYCYPDDMVDGEHLWTCLGDQFSDIWMKNTEDSNTNQITLEDQYLQIKGSIESNPMQWGDLSFTNEHISMFMGSGSNNKQYYNQYEKLKRSLQIQNSREFASQPKYLKNKGVNSRYVEFDFLVNMFNRNPTKKNFAALQKYCQKTVLFNNIFQNFNNLYQGILNSYQSGSETNFTCYRYTIEKLESMYGKLNEQSYDKLIYLYQYCSLVKEYTSVQFNL